MMKSSSRLQTEFAIARFIAKAGSRWKHKKGGLYEVTGHSFNTTTEEIDVLYRRYGGPDYDEQAERGIVFNRRLKEWTMDMFTLL